MGYIENWGNDKIQWEKDLKQNIMDAIEDARKENIEVNFLLCTDWQVRDDEVRIIEGFKKIGYTINTEDEPSYR
jgi:hypothetical protein